jgi:hypothetical protein
MNGLTHVCCHQPARNSDRLRATALVQIQSQSAAGPRQELFYYDANTAVQTADVLLSLTRKPLRLNWPL